MPARRRGEKPAPAPSWRGLCPDPDLEMEREAHAPAPSWRGLRPDAGPEMERDARACAEMEKLARPTPVRPRRAGEGMRAQRRLGDGARSSRLRLAREVRVFTSG